MHLDDSSKSNLRFNNDFSILDFHSFRSYKRYKTLFANKDVGSLKATGDFVYYCTKIQDKNILCHRIVYALANNISEIIGDIDHIDGNTQNNNPSNLRMCSRSENCMNARGKGDSRTGLKGVAKRSRKRKDGSVIYESAIMYNGKYKFIGSFKSANAAHEAYCEQAKLLHGEYANF